MAGKSGSSLYTAGTPWYYVLNVLLCVYGLGFIASLVLLTNAYVPHTYTAGTTYGTLYSGRFVSGYWIALMFCALRVFIPIIVANLLLYRETYCCKTPGSGCIIFWVIFLVILVMMDLMGFTLLAGYYNKCNGIGAVDNPCNDKRWCCAPEIYSDVGNLCHNTIGCSPAVALTDMRPNADFLWLFWTGFAFIIGDLIFLIAPLALWLQDWDKKQSITHEDFMDEEEDVNADDADGTQPLYQVAASVRRRKK
jgi:hypothetical protein